MTGTSLHPLDEATRLVRESDGVYRGETSEYYWNMTGPFGGVTAAILMRAALEHPERIGEPLSITVNFCAPIAQGPFRVTARAAKTNRSTQHFIIELTQDSVGVAATATAVFAARRATWEHRPVKPPVVPAFDALKRFSFEGRNAWLQRYDMRYVEGAPNFGSVASGELKGTRTVLRLRDAPERPLDFVSLTALSDTFIVRVFIVRGTFVPAGTVSMTTYFHAGSEELAAQGMQPLLGVADAKVFERGYFDQVSELWSADGKLLATSTQIVYFRE